MDVPRPPRLTGHQEHTLRALDPAKHPDIAALLGKIDGQRTKIKNQEAKIERQRVQLKRAYDQVKERNQEIKRLREHTPDDTECIDAQGDVHPEHDCHGPECRHCGAEPDDE
ncbi:hypothetical protein E6R60_26645 [Streptomyces sp. A0642]|uniref:hypothetical protein n=1 Tax=Streptomyces sp. A0642 TaxID=2563100 RepID=UPI0010A21536|nr:hypothetical protein [Streptomyces sp. A0642]THA72512.1 hypothetical protein E6R60_26645 [Streptomyces sp. A0642]